LSVPEQDNFRPFARGDEEPVFDEPWQAQILALANDLAEKNVFTRAQWSDALGAALKNAAGSGKPDTPGTYYACALEALEQLMAGHGAVSADSLDARIEEWRRAYINTPHGDPVELDAGKEN
jgi:nitrile hydratase accessory protein